MAIVEATLINNIAGQERSVAGVRNSYDFAQNPDSIPAAALPAVLHYTQSFSNELRAHHNAWKETINLKSILLVAPRMDSGGKLRFLENAAIPFGYLWRNKFQDDTVISNLLANVVAVRCFLSGGEYGAGGVYLTVAGTEYIGWVFSWSVVSA